MGKHKKGQDKPLPKTITIDGKQYSFDFLGDWQVGVPFVITKAEDGVLHISNYLPIMKENGDVAEKDKEKEKDNGKDNSRDR